MQMIAASCQLIILYSDAWGWVLFFNKTTLSFRFSAVEDAAEANRGGNKISPSTNWEQVKVNLFQNKVIQA